MATYIESYLHLLRDLPNDIHRTYALIGVLDQKVSRLKRKLHRSCEEFYKMAAENKKPPTEFAQKLRKIRKDQREIHSLNEDKIELTNQAQYYVNSFMKRLDMDLKKFENELGAQQIAAATEEAEASRQTGRNARRRADDAHGRREKRQKTEGDTDDAYKSSASNTKQKKGTDDKVYCLCRRGFYGNMVGCDGEDCPIEWFHFECVGLEEQPKGEWYCPQCRQGR